MSVPPTSLMANHYYPPNPSSNVVIGTALAIKSLKTGSEAMIEQFGGVEFIKEIAFDQYA